MNRLLSISAIAAVLVTASTTALAQRQVDERNFGERLVIIVPLTGDGSPRSPYRPLFAPTAEEIHEGKFLGFTAVLSDDKRFALMEVVARDRSAFEGILKDTRPDVKKFDVAKGARREEIELEFRKLKKDFDWAKFKEGK